MKVISKPLKDCLYPKKQDTYTTYAVHTYTKEAKDINDTEIVFIKEQICDKDGNTYPNFKILIDPISSFYIVKPQYRTYKYKKEKEPISRLDEYKSEHKFQYEQMRKILNAYSREYQYKGILNHPYVYGADIDIASLYKMAYANKNEDKSRYTVKIAYLDIEKDMSTKQINVLSITYMHTVYVFINRQYMAKYDRNTNNRHTLTLDDIKSVTYNTIGSILNEHKFDIQWNVLDNEHDLLIEVFNFLHSIDIDFVTIWNMNYDVPELVSSMLNNGLQPETLFSHPLIPEQYRTFKYKEDKSKRDHYVLKWHWVYAISAFQWIDSMTLYAWNRRTQPYEESYALDHILRKEVDLGKLFVITDHREFQKYRFDEYVAYNIIDTLAFALLDRKTGDIQRMYDLSLIFDIKNYSYSTIRLRNSYYYFYKKRGYIIASVNRKYPLPYEDEVIASGGAVATSQNGIFITSHDNDSIVFNTSLLSTNCADFDYTSLYPSVIVGLRISRDNMVYGTLGIDNMSNENVFDFYSRLALLDDNVVSMCNKYFNLPNFHEMYKLISRRIGDV